METRPSSVAGQFYPGAADTLANTIEALITNAQVRPTLRPKALIVPHAGYVYSGSVAASAFRLLQPLREQIKRVVLLGPAHRLYLRGIALPSANAFETPLGLVPVDHSAVKQILNMPGVLVSDEAHALEHSLEVQLPFLQQLLSDFSLLPLVIGDASPEQVAAVLDTLWDGPQTLIVVSSDLSHYHSYEEAQRRDAATSNAIVAKHSDIQSDMACGAAPINGLMRSEGAQSLQVRLLDVRNSGDTSGDHTRVVGYGAYALEG